MKAAEIRDTYLDFFAERGHKIVPSASLVPSVHDPSVLLTTAGMQPFKPYFLGRERPPAPRLADVQKCFRTTDIEEVGNTARHLTFFEMLGNWSFGDYFKAESIPWGWQLATEGFGMDPEKIWATVFGGDEELGLGPDEEAIEIWKGVGMPEERIVLLGREDNFWQAGPSGPCGPCSELYLDRGEGFGGAGERPGDDTDRFLEFWNHVFMTYDLSPDGVLSELPMRNIDTGMGLDRMAAILQDAPSVFETDLVRPLIDLAEQLSGRSYGEGGAVTRAMRIVADHSRGAAFLIADGVVPSNEDRGYILRRIMRRAIQQGRTLGLEAPWLGRFAERTIEVMAEAYPELASERATIARWVGDEEESFGRTLERGTELLERLVAEAKQSGTSWIDAADAFKLHDTYGFPYDLTKELLAERGLSVDDGGFEELMEEQRQRARVGAATAHGSEDRHEKVLAFAAAAPPTRFVGYETLRATTGLAAVAADDGRALVKLEDSPFYAEGGGQVADSGVLRWDGVETRVLDVYRVGDDQALEVEAAGGVEAGVAVEALVDHETRHATMRNHTATHLLHAALRERLGDHVRQAGSAVRPDKLRFDFTHGQALAAEDLVRDRGPGQRVDQGEPPGALAGDGARRRGSARRDGAVRREIRRVGAGGRGRRGLARALRRHARRQHRRGRHLQALLRGLLGRQRAADRGADRPGGDRLVPRRGAAPARGRRAARLAAGPADGRPPRRRAPARGGRGREAGGEADAGRGGRAPGRRGRAGRRHRGGRGAGADRRPEAAARAGQPGAVEARRRVGDRARRRQRRQGRAGRARLQGRRRRRRLGGERGAGGGGRRRRRRRRTRRDGAGRGEGRFEARRGAGDGAAGDRSGCELVRVLALDHGTARIGCAISDPSGTLATPLPTIEPPEASAVADLVAEREVERVVVGLPLHLSGEEGSQAALARSFCAELTALLEVPVETYDERLTTRMADASKRAGAAAPADSLAAAHLLQAYLAGQAAIGGTDEDE